MTRTHRSLLALALALACGLASPAFAAEAGSWSFSLGAHVVDPTSGNGSLAGGALEADVGSDWKPTITAEYFFTPNLGLEVLAALPFEHDISLNGAKAGSTKTCRRPSPCSTTSMAGRCRRSSAPG